MKKVLIIVFIFVLLFVIVFAITSNNKRNKNIQNPQNNTTQEKLSDQDMINNYLKNNISQLSPEKEVLGGKFYITDLQLQEGNKGIVSYEDGHIALKANFDYIINDKLVEINNFEIIQDDSVTTENHLKCTTHEDCVPLPSCHPHECINKKFIDQYKKAEVCTELFDFCAAYKEEDCICQQGTCFDENLMSKDCNK